MEPLPFRVCFVYIEVHPRAYRNHVFRREEQLRFNVACIGVLCAVVALAAPAQEYRDALTISDQQQLYNARSLGMGNAYTTIGYEFAAIRANPAALGNIDSTIYTMSINFNAFRNSTTLFGAETNFGTENTTLSQFGLAFPFSFQERNLVVALGYNQGRDFNRTLKYGGFNTSSQSLIGELTSRNSSITSTLGLSYPAYDPATSEYLGQRTVITGNLTEQGFLLEDGLVSNYSFGLGYEVMYNVFFGASISYVSGQYTIDREFTEEDTENMYPASVETVPGTPSTADFRRFYLHDVRDLAFNGWDMRVGLIYKLENFIAVGGSFKIPSHTKVSDIQYLEGYAVYNNDRQQNLEQSKREVEYSLAPPYEITGGAAVNLWILTVTAEASWIDYTQIRYVSGGDLPDLTLRNKEFAENLRGAINLNGGAEFRLPWTGISARAGAMFRQSPFKDAPAKAGRKYLTAGIGINSGGRLAFDVGYSIGWWDEVLETYGVHTPNLSQTVVVHNMMTTLKLSL